MTMILPQREPCSSFQGSTGDLITALQVWRAPDELLAQHRSTYNPPVPVGGWQAAVSAAAAAKGDEDTQLAALSSQPSFQGALTLSMHPSQLAPALQRASPPRS